MKSANQYSQVSLITSRQKGTKLQYQVQKEGVLFLRKFRSKKLRIVFNVVPLRGQNCEEVLVTKKFNQSLLSDEGQKQKSKQCLETIISPQTISLSPNQSPYLTISTNPKQISDNRTIIIFNAYLPITFTPPSLLIFGYLISSLILYHNFTNQFSEQSHLTKMLCDFSQQLHKTNIDDLNEEIKFKSGYKKMPYFMCLLRKTEEMSEKQCQNWMNERYRFQSQKQHSKINSALQTIIDYFPQRSSLGISLSNTHTFPSHSIKQIHQLGKQFQQTILGRQLFNFQFTGATVQNIVFQMCEVFNLEEKQINLIDLYENVVMNRKGCLETEYVRVYLEKVRKEVFLGGNVRLQVEMEEWLKKDNDYKNNLKQVKSILPMSDCHLHNVLKQIHDSTIFEASQQATNCMNLQQYLQCQHKLKARIKQYQQKLIELNHESGVKFVDQCFAVLDISEENVQFFQQSKEERQQNAKEQYRMIETETVHEVFVSLLGRLEGFSNQCIQMFTYNDNNATIYNETFLRLIRQYFSKLQAKVIETVEQFNLKNRKNTLQINKLRHELKVSQQQKKRLQQQYQLQLLMESQLKQKIQSLVLGDGNGNGTQPIKLKKLQSMNGQFVHQSKQIYRMKKHIEELEEEVKDKTNHIEELHQILQKFQLSSISPSSQSFQSKLISSQKRQQSSKFNQTTQRLINEASEKIMKFYTLLEEVKNVEKQYQGAKKLLLKERNKIILQKKQIAKQFTTIKEKSQKLQLENQKLQQIIMEDKKAIENFKHLKQTLKESIDSLQATNAELKCTLAEEQGELEMYHRKALTLVVEQYVKGKSENLQKFYKFLEHEEIRSMIKTVLGKK